MEYLEAPCEIPVNGLQSPTKRSIFLAGGISGCPDWQSYAVRQLSDLPVRIYNPRRKEFPEKSENLQDDPKNEQDARAQITWEFEALATSDIILFWFPEESICPI